MSALLHRSRHLVPLVAVQAVGLGCGLIGVRWMSSLVPPELMATYGLLLGTQLFGASVTHQGLVQHVQRYWRGGVAGRQYGAMLGRAAVRPSIVLAGGLALLALVSALSDPAAPGLPWWPWMLAVNLLTVGAWLAHAALQAEERYWSHFTVSAIASVTRTFLPLLLVVTGGATLGRLAGGFALHTGAWALAGGLLWWHLGRRAADPAVAPAPPPEAMVGAFAWAGLASWLAGNAVRWIAAYSLPQDETGFFILALNLATIVPASVGLISANFTFPALYAAARQGEPEPRLWRMTAQPAVAAIAVGQLGLLLMAAVAPLLVGPIIAPTYTRSLPWLLAAGGSGLASVATALFCNLLLARERPRDCLRLTLASAGFRLAVMVLAAGLGETALRWSLTLLPWPTLGLEAWLARRWSRHATPATASASSTSAP